MVKIIRREIPINELRALLRFDEEGNLWWKIPKMGRRKNRPAGCNGKHGYKQIMINGEIFLAHRVIFALYYGFWPNEQIDHINGNKGDNRIENLREASHSQNNHNRPNYRNNTTGFKGVHTRKDYNKFLARIRINGVAIHLGVFDTAEEASAAYRQAAIKYHKDYAAVIVPGDMGK